MTAVQKFLEATNDSVLTKDENGTVCGFDRDDGRYGRSADRDGVDSRCGYRSNWSSRRGQHSDREQRKYRRHTTTTSDRSGNYNFQSLPIGTYVVSAQKAGFNRTANNAFALEIDQVAKIDFKLQVGSVNTTVDVASDAGTMLQTEDATLGTTLTSNTISSMPLSGQNFSAATVFVPGAVDPTYNAMGGANGTERDTSQTSIPSYNGNRQQTNNYIYDGVDINEPLNNVIAYNPAPEAIGQMRVITGNAEAEYGNVNGGEDPDGDQVGHQ